MDVLNEFEVKNKYNKWKSVDFVQLFYLLFLFLNFSFSAFEDLIAAEIGDITLFPENAIPTQLRPHKTAKWWRYNLLRKHSKKGCEIVSR